VNPTLGPHYDFPSTHKGHHMLDRTNRTTPPRSTASQVTKPVAALDLPPKLPDDPVLSGQGVVDLIDKARVMRSAFNSRSQKSLCHELTMCVHAALHITNQDQWDNFCEWSELDARTMPDKAGVLYSVLLEYTGKDTDGRKAASRYKRALRSLFEGQTPALVIYEELRRGGVDGLLGNAKPRVDRKKALSLPSVTISTPGTYRTELLPGTSHKFLVSSKLGGIYELTVRKVQGKAKRAIKLHKKTK